MCDTISSTTHRSAAEKKAEKAAGVALRKIAAAEKKVKKAGFIVAKRAATAARKATTDKEKAVAAAKRAKKAAEVAARKAAANEKRVKKAGLNAVKQAAAAGKRANAAATAAQWEEEAPARREASIVAREAKKIAAAAQWAAEAPARAAARAQWIADEPARRERFNVEWEADRPAREARYAQYNAGNAERRRVANEKERVALERKEFLECCAQSVKADRYARDKDLKAAPKTQDQLLLSKTAFQTEDCPICLSDLGETTVMTLRCGHKTCGDCVVRHFQTVGGTKCPVCREQYAVRQLRYMR